MVSYQWTTTFEFEMYPRNLEAGVLVLVIDIFPEMVGQKRILQNTYNEMFF